MPRVQHFSARLPQILFDGGRRPVARIGAARGDPHIVCAIKTTAPRRFRSIQKIVRWRPRCRWCLVGTADSSAGTRAGAHGFAWIVHTRRIDVPDRKTRGLGSHDARRFECTWLATCAHSAGSLAKSMPGHAASERIWRLEPVARDAIIDDRKTAGRYGSGVTLAGALRPDAS